MEKPHLAVLNFFVLLLIFSVNINKAYSDSTILRPHTTGKTLSYIQPSPPHIASSAHILIDADSGKILAEKDSELKKPPASLTKMMTVYVVASALKSGQLKLNDQVTISKRAWKTPGSKMFIKQGQRVSIEDLLQGIIVDSGNDACVAISEYIAGSEQAFVGLMNKQAHLLGMTNTHFTDSTGLPNPDLYSTAKDLAILSRALVKDFPEYYHWFKQKWFKFNGIKQPNRNRLLWRNALVDGIKTGHTDKAGYALVASAKKANMRLIAVILGAPSDSARADSGQRLLSFGFRFYETHKLYEANIKITDARVWKGKQNSIGLGIESPLYITIPTGTYANLDISTTLTKHIEAPVKDKQALGELIIKLDGKVISQRSLVALSSVQKGGLFARMGDSIHLSFKRLFN